MSKRRPLVMGNWKLNGSNQFNLHLVNGLKEALKDVEGVDVAVAPPALYAGQVKWALGDAKVAVGAQNVDVHLQGAFTGEVSAQQLKDIGVTHVIIGHSERRQYHHESNEYIAEKFGVLKAEGLVPVLCVGETEQENEAGLTQKVVAEQLDAVIKAHGVEALNGAVVAYEPVWAIGTGKTATPEQAQAVHAFLRGHVAKLSPAVAEQLVIQYGGSVNDKNAETLFGQPDIDGALVGGASLKADAFAVIVKAAAKVKGQ